MSSLLRRMERRFDRQRSDYQSKAQPIKILPNGGYQTLTPTNGWMTICGARLRAQHRMAIMLDHARPIRRKKAAKVWRKPMKAVPSVETRQQRRWAKRKGTSITAHLKAPTNEG